MINISGAPPNSILIPNPPFYDNYSGPANPACFLTLDAAQDWAGQSFTTTFRYNLQHVDFWLKKGPGANVGNIFVQLHAVDGNGHPTGPPLCSGIIPDADISEDYAWVSCLLDELSLTFYLLSKDTKYCIVVRGLGLDVDNPLIWACGGDGSDYPNGDQEWSINSGTDWATDTTRDQMFRCYPPPFQDNYSGTTIPFAGLTLDAANEWTAQTFTAMKSYNLNRIDHWFRKDPGDNVGNIIVALYDIDGEGHPDIIGGALATGIIPDVDVPEVYGWVRCNVSGFNIVVDTKYAIVLHGPSLSGANKIRLSYFNGGGVDGAYLDGNKEWSLTSGVTWGSQLTSDNLFRCYGD